MTLTAADKTAPFKHVSGEYPGCIPRPNFKKSHTKINIWVAFFSPRLQKCWNVFCFCFFPPSPRKAKLFCSQTLIFRQKLRVRDRFWVSVTLHLCCIHMMLMNMFSCLLCMMIATMKIVFVEADARSSACQATKEVFSRSNNCHQGRTRGWGWSSFCRNTFL